MTWQHPFPESTISSVFGTTRNRKTPHRGVDYAPGVKELIRAVTAGRVELVQWSDILGWVMVQSSASGKYSIGYCHLNCAQHGPYCKGPKVNGCDSPYKNLKVGDSVELGQVVGRVGSTGSASTGPHLHLTLGRDTKSVFYGKVIDPQKYINKQIAKHGEASDAVQGQTQTKEKVEPELATEIEDCEPSEFDKPPKGIVAALEMILKWLKSLGVTEK